MSTLKWAPLPNGRPWWPAIVVDSGTVDESKHPEAVQFWNAQRERRGADALSKDTLILLCGLVNPSDSDQGHRFAVVPRTSLRSYQMYVQSFTNGIVASGKNSGQQCDENDRKELQRALQQLAELCKNIPQAQLQQVVTSPKGGAGQLPILGVFPGATQTAAVAPVTKTKAGKVVSEESRELVRLKKELSSIRRKISTRTAQRTQSTSPPATATGGSGTTTARSESPAVLPGLETKGAQQASVAAQQGEPPLVPEYYPEINSQTLRIWDFSHSFSQELNLTPSGVRRPFASLTSFEACLTEPDCSLFAQVACQLASYLSVSKGSDPEDRWEFNHQTGKVQAKLGSRCTPLTWESLWNTLVERGIVQAPADPNNKRAILDNLVQACSELDCTKTVFSWRLNEFASELSTGTSADAQLPPITSQVELRPSYGTSPSSRKILTADVPNCADLFQVERLIDGVRLEHETLDMESGAVLSRTEELANAMAWEEKLLARYLSSIRALQLSKRTRSISFGKDHCGRSLFTFCGDDDEEECRVWAREDDTDRWHVYRGELAVGRLINVVPDREVRQVLFTVLYASRRRYRPTTVALTRAAKNQGWRFFGNALLWRKVKKYDVELGVRQGVICSWRIVQGGRVSYKVVFGKDEWKNGWDMWEDELIHLIACGERLLGDFRVHPGMLPPHPYLPPTHYMWHPMPQETLALVQGPTKKYRGLGVVLATTAPLHAEDYDALVLQDGGELVVISGKKLLQEAVIEALRSSPHTLAAMALNEGLDPSIIASELTRFPRIERFHPLTHRSGPTVGVQGIAEFCLGGKPAAALNNVSEVREPLLALEENQSRNRPNLWGQDFRQGQTWRTFVQNAQTVREFALAAECLADFVARAAASSSLNYLRTAQAASQSLGGGGLSNLGFPQKRLSPIMAPANLMAAAAGNQGMGMLELPPAFVSGPSAANMLGFSSSGMPMGTQSASLNLLGLATSGQSHLPTSSLLGLSNPGMNFPNTAASGFLGGVVHNAAFGGVMPAHLGGASSGPFAGMGLLQGGGMGGGATVANTSSVSPVMGDLTNGSGGGFPSLSTASSAMLSGSSSMTAPVIPLSTSSLLSSVQSTPTVPSSTPVVQSQSTEPVSMPTAVPPSQVKSGSADDEEETDIVVVSDIPTATDQSEPLAATEAVHKNHLPTTGIAEDASSVETKPVEETSVKTLTSEKVTKDEVESPKEENLESRKIVPTEIMQMATGNPEEQSGLEEKERVTDEGNNKRLKMTQKEESAAAHLPILETNPDGTIRTTISASTRPASLSSITRFASEEPVSASTVSPLLSTPVSSESMVPPVNASLEEAGKDSVVESTPVTVDTAGPIQAEATPVEQISKSSSTLAAPKEGDRAPKQEEGEGATTEAVEAASSTT